MQPLFPDYDDAKERGFALPYSKKEIKPAKSDGRPNPAAELIRRKLDSLYDSEPRALDELKQDAQQPKHRSKHQEFMHGLSTSGKSLAQIQSEWHRYYSKLPDAEKHEVWQEFYQASQRHPSNYTRFINTHAAHPSPGHDTKTTASEPPHNAQANHKRQVVLSEHTDPNPEPKTPPTPSRERSLAAVRKRILAKVSERRKAAQNKRKHVQTLVFGLSMGALASLIMLFGFLNEVIIAPLIQPSRSAAATPIILDTEGVAPSPEPQIIIPKINAQLPVVYDLTSSRESVVQEALNDGVIHYPSTVLPGQKGNAAIFGHSSNNILNPGKYKFAFVLLHEMEPGDIFYISLNSKLYTYKVFKKQVVEPSDTWVLSNVEGKPATATLITCDPPGTSRHRLVVWGEQITPQPNANPAGQAPEPTAVPQMLTSEGPTLWTRLWRAVNPFD